MLPDTATRRRPVALLLSATLLQRCRQKSHGKYMLPSHTMKEVYSSYGLDDNTCDFVGHALALHTDDSYKQRSCKETILKAQLYAESLARCA